MIRVVGRRNLSAANLIRIPSSSDGMFRILAGCQMRFSRYLSFAWEDVRTGARMRIEFGRIDVPRALRACLAD
jgi:hypothetical protein